MTAWPPDPRCARRCKPCECTSRRAWLWPSRSAPPAPVRNSPISRMKPCALARRSRSPPSDCGTATFLRPPTRKSARCYTNTLSASEPGVSVMSDRDTLDVLRRAAVWFEPSADGFGPLLDAVGDARLVLIGEASHGTHEFYRARAEFTKTLILRKGFNIVAVEADWPDAYRANRWIRGI